MSGRACLSVIVTVLVIVILVAYGMTQVNLSALPEPGRFETFVATQAKQWYLERASRGPLPPAPPRDVENVAAGSAIFNMACASCHGRDGRTPTPMGRSMYPRVLDLGSPEVQKLQDRELFWVVKNGIRLSGMPGFARINTDRQIWQLVYFVRSLGRASRRPASRARSSDSSGNQTTEQSR